MLKLHLVFDADAKPLADFLKKFTILTGWDFTLDTAAQWSASQKGEAPDIILIDGSCDISSVDTTTGTLNRDNAVLKRLTEIKVSRPQSRIIILLHPEKEKCKELLGGLVSIGIYDIYFVDDFSEQSIQNWINSSKSLADVQHLLPHVVPAGGNAEVFEVKFHKAPGGSPTKAPVQVHELTSEEELQRLFHNTNSDMAAYLEHISTGNYKVKVMLGNFCHIFKGKSVTLNDIEIGKASITTNSKYSCPILRLTKNVAILPHNNNLIILGKDGKFHKNLIKSWKEWCV